MFERDTIHGAKWWKFDFHVHTPASNDFGKGDAREKSISPKDWLLACMAAEIDCVAITDHNSGEWIDLIKVELEKLETENHEHFRKLYVFPGVEISVCGNCHVLAIFDTMAGTKDVSALLGSVGFEPTNFGTSDSVTIDSIEKVLEKIIKAGAVAIPAHTDKVCGLFDKFSGNTLAQALKSEGLLAIELVDESFSKPDTYIQAGVNLTEVVGTDSHLLRQIGTNFTWVKMHVPSLNALKLALHDGSDGVIRKKADTGDPNMIADRYFIRSIEVNKAYKSGRSLPMVARFSPWLSSVIGGRGCGKSSLINFLRLSLGRDGDMPVPIQRDFDFFRKIGSRQGPGMLTNETELTVEISKDGSMHRVVWRYNRDDVQIQKWDDETESWATPLFVSNIAELFPIQVFSQKELYNLTDEPAKLLDVIDSQFDKDEWKTTRDELISKWLAGRLSERNLKGLVNGESNLKTQISLLEDRIKIYESSAYKETLSKFTTYSEMRTFFEESSGKVETFISAVEDLNKRFPDFSKKADLIESLDYESVDFLNGIESTLNLVRLKLEEAVNLLSAYRGRTAERSQSLPWKIEHDKANVEYQSIADKIKELGAETYESLVQRRSVFKEKIQLINEAKATLSTLSKSNKEIYDDIIKHEKRLREFRLDILNRWSFTPESGNPGLIVELNPMSNSENGNKSFRDLIRKPGEEFSKYIYLVNSFDGESEGLIPELASSSVEDRWQKREEILNRLLTATEVSPKDLDRRLIKHMQNLRLNTPEDIDRLLVWVPDDEITLRFVKDGRPQDIQSGSAGERVAGMLGLLLALNDVPLIIDQPEDDLDTRLISNFVVPAFQKLKVNRQLILVTHNPNIAVNASSDTIIHMNFHSAQILIAANNALQDKNIRQAVCDVMEGGREALNKRYYRISKALKS